jgi:hypothetical protein
MRFGGMAPMEDIDEVVGWNRDEGEHSNERADGYDRTSHRGW